MAKEKIGLGSTLKLGKISDKPTKEEKKVEDMVKKLSNKKEETPKKKKPVAKKISEKSKRITFDVPQSTHIKIKRQAIDSGFTIKELMTKMVQEYFNL